MTLPPGTADLAADLLLRFYREPLRYRAQMLHADHLLGGPEWILRLALGRPVELADPALDQPGVAVELRRAAVFFIQQVFFRDHATHYQVLGLTPDAEAGVIRDCFRLLMQLTHPDRNDLDSMWPEAFAASVNRAYTVLKDPAARAAYDRQLAARAESAPRERYLQPPAKPRGAVPRRAWRRPAQPVLPEWMTAELGGFLWRHPAPAILGGLVLASAIVIALVVRSELDGVLIRDAPLLARPLAADPVPRPHPELAAAVLTTAAGNESHADPALTQVSAPALPLRPSTDEIEALLAVFLASYEAGRSDALAGLFDEEAQFNLRRGRAAIRSDYDELFQRSAWRRINLTQLRPEAAGGQAQAKGQVTLRIEWRDGRDSEQRLAFEMEFVRRDGRALIARLSSQPAN